jgi:hypothetical protein
MVWYAGYVAVVVGFFIEILLGQLFPGDEDF